jgi:aryl-alcohol dehydrogenase-like predicted oxidoreductase
MQHLLRAEICGLDALADEARARGVEMSALALAWVLSHPRVDAAIIGPRSLSHLAAALDSLTIDLSESDRARIATPFSDR